MNPSRPSASLADSLFRKDGTLRDKTVIGEKTRHDGVNAVSEKPEWLADFPVCGILEEFCVHSLGIVQAFPPYLFVRESPSVAEFLACVRGEGLVLIEGKWQTCGRGQGVMIPMHTAVAYQAVGDDPWELAWICYVDKSLASHTAPWIADYPGGPLFFAVKALIEECRTGQDSACVRALMSAIHRFVLRFPASPSTRAERLHALWRKVEADLKADWTLDRLASEAKCSTEHLRRICQRETGRSPMDHVARLRMRHASELLIWTDHKVEYIASLVGYGDAFAFSAKFKKWSGFPPTKYRQQFGQAQAGQS